MKREYWRINVSHSKRKQWQNIVSIWGYIFVYSFYVTLDYVINTDLRRNWEGIGFAQVLKFSFRDIKQKVIILISCFLNVFGHKMTPRCDNQLLKTACDAEFYRLSHSTIHFDLIQKSIRELFFSVKKFFTVANILRM